MLTKLLSIKEASKILGKSPNTVRRLIKIGKLPATLEKSEKGYKYCISVSDLTNYLTNISGNHCEATNSAYQIGKVENSQTFAISVSKLYQDYQTALVRLGQLENQRLMLTERVETLQKMHTHYEQELQILREALEKEKKEKEDLIEKLKEVTRKRWWEFWKRPVSFQIPSISQNS